MIDYPSWIQTSLENVKKNLAQIYITPNDVFFPITGTVFPIPWLVKDFVEQAVSFVLTRSIFMFIIFCVESFIDLQFCYISCNDVCQ